MKANETKTIGNATVTKRIQRSSVTQRLSTGAKIGRRCFSDTHYVVKALDGRMLDIVRSFEAAVAVAERA